MSLTLLLLIFLLITPVSYVDGQTDTLSFSHAEGARRKWAVPLVEIPLVNVLTNRINVWVKDEDWARVSLASWKNNFKTGFRTDGDKFSTNFLGHPVHGSWYFNSARSSGNSFWSSLPYTVGGSLMWEFLGETEAPSEIDINTTCFGGFFLGELTHRISRHLLSNDKKRSKRFLRNFSAFALNPMAVINGALYPEFRQRLTAPLPDHLLVRSQLSLGINFPVGEITSNKVTTRMHLSYDLIYGTLFDGESGFKPFDFFVFRTWADLGLTKVTNPFLFNISAHAPVVRWALKDGLAITISQHYDFLKNQIFELGNLSITGDLYYRLNAGERQWMLAAKAGAIPFGSTTSQVTTYLIAEGLLSPNRNYLYGAGLALESQISLRFKNMARMSLKYNQWLLYPRREASGTERSQIVYFNNTFPLGKNHSLTFEIYHYFKKASYDELPGFGHIRKQYTEFRFMGNYNF